VSPYTTPDLKGEIENGLKKNISTLRIRRGGTSSIGEGEGEKRTKKGKEVWGCSTDQGSSVFPRRGTVGVNLGNL